MPQNSDASEFVDSDLEAARKNYLPSAASASAAGLGGASRAPTRDEVEGKVGEMQHKLGELKRAQQELERERAGLEETRRRQMEFTTGRQEMIQNLTRALGLLEEAEFSSRRDADQMAKAMIELREAMAKVESIHQESWTQDNFDVELTRA